MYEFQKQDSLQTLEEGLEEFYSINPAFKELLEIDSPNTKVFKEHDYTHVLFGMGTSMEEESLLDTYVICLLYTSPSPRDQRGSRMPSSA